MTPEEKKRELEEAARRLEQDAAPIIAKLQAEYDLLTPEERELKRREDLASVTRCLPRILTNLRAEYGSLRVRSEEISAETERLTQANMELKREIQQKEEMIKSLLDSGLLNPPSGE